MSRIILQNLLNSTTCLHYEPVGFVLPDERHSGLNMLQQMFREEWVCGEL